MLAERADREGGQILDQEIDDFDCGSFLSGLAAGLFRVERGDTILSPMLRPRADGSPTGFGLFEKVGPGYCQMRQEDIPHYAAVSELVLDYDWPVEQVAIESPPAPGLGGGALDILVFGDRDRTRAAIGAEAKAKRSQLSRMLGEMRRCGGSMAAGPHRAADHKKCLGLATFRPPLFLGVAGGVRTLLDVQHDGGRFRLSDEKIDLEALRVP